MVPNTRQMTVSELIEAIVPYIQKEQYSESYIADLKLVFKQFEKYCTEQEITKLTSEVVQNFLQYKGRFFEQRRTHEEVRYRLSCLVRGKPEKVGQHSVVRVRD